MKDKNLSRRREGMSSTTEVQTKVAGNSIIVAEEIVIMNDAGHEINGGVGNGNSTQLDLLGSGPAGQSQSSMTI